MQIDLLGELPPSGDDENTLTAMNVFSRHLFFYPTGSEHVTTFVRVRNNIIAKHAYLSTTMISDQGTSSDSKVAEFENHCRAY